MIGNAYAQSSLPKCPGSPVYNQDISGWDNCFGTYSYAGETYVGECNPWIHIFWCRDRHTAYYHFWQPWIE